MSSLRARLMRTIFGAVLGSGLFVSLPYCAGITAQAQNLGQRNVTGSVIDDRSAPVASATIFLKNQKTKAIRSYTSATDGRFRFTQVNMSDDFDLWAEKGDHKSAVKTISSWDARKDFETELKIK